MRATGPLGRRAETWRGTASRHMREGPGRRRAPFTVVTPPPPEAAPKLSPIEP